MYHGMYDLNSMMFLIPALLFSMYAQLKISTSFNKYLRVASRRGYTGSQVARLILDRNGLSDVRIEAVPGQLTDHYDPRTKVVRLSRDVYSGSSIAAVSVAAHEVGHAMQHGEGYFPLIIRNSMVPVVNISARFVWVLILLGLAISPFLLDVGIMLYLAVVLFQVITLPVEFNASRRALAQLENGIVFEEEIGASKDVLQAAALTYVAATLVALGQLLRLLSLSNRRR